MAIKQDLDKVLGSGYEAKVPDLDWASLTPKDTDNIPTANNVEVLPQLVEQLSNSPDRGARLVGLTEAPKVKKAVDLSKVTDEVVACAKREMMKGLKGTELASKMATMFPPSVIKVARDELSKVASEQGLLGNVYVDLSVFDSCREAAQVLGSNRVRLADYVIGSPRKHACSTHHEGYCKELRKTAVAEVPYGAELFDKYTKHLRVAGVIPACEDVRDKKSLRAALLKSTAKKHTTSIEVPERAADMDISKVTLEQAIDKAASERQAAEDRYASVRPVLSFMQDQMLRGVIGDELKKSVASKFSGDTIRACRKEMARLAALQGLVGTVYVDVGYYKSADDASKAISSAHTKPSYIVNTSPSAEYDGRIASVSNVTGCAPLPADGKIDRKVAQTYVNDLLFSGRISVDGAKKYASLLDAGRNPLSVLREAFLSTDRQDKSQKSAAQMGTWFTGSRKVSENREVLAVAAKQALEKGVPSDKVQAKLASSVSTAEATGMIHTILANLPEVDASCLKKCATEKYPLSKSARLKKASKCETCINCAGTACLKQGVKFAGAEDYDKAFFDASAFKEASDKLEVIGVYDNGGKTADRYTVVYNQKSGGMHECLGMSENPSHPQGFGQHSTCQLGSHLGKKIKLTDLPEACQKVVKQDLDSGSERTAADKPKGEKKSEKYSPKDDVSPEVKKVLLKDNPDAEREDMKQPYDMSDDIGSGNNKAMQELHDQDMGGEEKDKKGAKKDSKKDK